MAQYNTIEEFLFDGMYARLDVGDKRLPAGQLLPSRLTCHCQQCGHQTTSERSDNPSSLVGYQRGEDSTNVNNTLAAGYRCCHCRAHTTSFAIAVNINYDGKCNAIQKVGQYPPPPVTVAKAIKKALNDDQIELYKKGVRCMNMGYGLASAAYFRRLIEDAGDQFLDLIIKSADLEKDDGKKQKALDAKAGTQIKEKLKQARDMLPAFFIYGGVNPLARMYSILSNSVHSANDEECLETSKELKEHFDFVFESCAESLEKAKSLSKYGSRQ